MKKRKRIVEPKNDEFFLANYLNDATYNDYFERMKKIALSIFEWENLPETCNAEYLELCLFEKGVASLLYEDNIGFINANAIANEGINIYNIPIKFNCQTANGLNFYRDLYIANSGKEKNKECILIKNNQNKISTMSSITLFCYRLYIAERTIDTNMHAQRTPVTILCDDKQLYTVKNLYAKYDGFEPLIIGQKDLDQFETVKVLKTDAPYLIDKLEQYKEKIWNEALSFLGINNIAIEKKERLTENESNVNNELINMNLQSFLAPRLQACKEFNEKFKPEKQLTVKVRSDLENYIKKYMNSIGNSKESEVKTNV